jgi:hypothetical protein
VSACCTDNLMCLLQGYFILLSSVLSIWSTAIGVMACRKKFKENSRLHSVKIVLNESEEPVLLEEDQSTTRYA